jgi:hypothetical protein
MTMTRARVTTIHLSVLGSLLAAVMAFPTAHAQPLGPQTTYESRQKNPFGHKGLFMLAYPTGLAEYTLQGAAANPVRTRLHHYLDQPSSSDPRVCFTIYKEHDSQRLWAFQLNLASPGEYVIYTNPTGVWWKPEAWDFYDLAYKYPDWY